MFLCLTCLGGDREVLKSWAVLGRREVAHWPGNGRKSWSEKWDVAMCCDEGDTLVVQLFVAHNV